VQREPVCGRGGVSCQADGSNERGGGDGGAGALGGRLAELTLRNLDRRSDRGGYFSEWIYTANNCGTTLAAGGECSIALTGTGPGSITVTAANSTAQTQALPALGTAWCSLRGLLAEGTGLRRGEFGLGAVTRTITVTNLTQQSQSSLRSGTSARRPLFLHFRREDQ